VMVGALVLGVEVSSRWRQSREAPEAVEDEVPVAEIVLDAGAEPVEEEVAPEPAAVPGAPTVAHPKKSKSEAIAWITVDAKKSWGKVKVNGKELGPTPIYRHAVTPGRLKVEVVRPDGARAEKSTTVKAGDDRLLMFDL
jgi:hypothetical protein